MTSVFFRKIEKLVLSNIARFKVAFGGSIEHAFQGYERVLENHLDDVLRNSEKDYEVFARLSYVNVKREDMPQNVLNRLIRSDSDNITRSVNSYVSGVTDTTRNQISKVINNNRDDFDKMVKRIKDKFKEMSRTAHSRAETIARTEIQKVSNLGALRGAIEGGATHKEWVWSGIERDFHASIEGGGAIPLNQDFISGLGNPLSIPGDSPIAEEVINCGCDVNYLALTDAEVAEL
jgi:hypothetical protein